MTREETENDASDQMMNEQGMDDTIIKDKYYLTYIVFYCLGTAMMIPANFFPTATDYWMYKFRDPNLANYTSENRTGLQAAFVSTYSIVSNVSNILFLVLAIIFLRKISVVKKIIGALGGATAMFAVTCLFVQMNTDDWQKAFFVITLIIGFLLTACCAVFMVTLFELIAKFPAQYLAVILSGQAICGIFAALVQIFALSIGASSTITGLCYFFIGMFFVFMTLVAFLATLRKSEFFQHNLSKKIVQVVQPKITKEKFLRVLNKLKYYLTSMIVVLGCSIMIHPGVTSLVVSENKGSGKKWNDVFFVPVVTFLLYHVLDYIGRELAGFIKKPKNGLFILLLSLLRIGFVPMLMYCNAQPRSHLPVAFGQDWVYITIIIIFAFTNGYLVNLCVIQVPTVTTEDEKKLSMGLILVFMIVSLGACSFISAALVKAL